MAVPPYAGFAAGLPDDGSVKFLAEAELIDLGDEHLREQGAALGVIPAYQALCTTDVMVVTRYQRLVVQLQLAALHGPA